MPSKSSMPSMAELKTIISNSGEDFVRKALEQMLNLMMELEAEAKQGREKHARTNPDAPYRNGTRKRNLNTTAGAVTLAIPKFRSGESYFPSFLEPRRMADKALVNVIQEAYINGVSTRKVDRLVEDLGMHIDKSAVSRLCKELDVQVTAFRNRPLEGAFPYLWLDATFPKVREGGHVVSMAFMTAIAVDGNGNRHVLGFDVGTSETGAHWTEFLQSLVNRGLRGVQLVISDSHAGLKNAIFSVLPGAQWQRCRVHCMRNILCNVPRKQQGMVSAMVRTIFAQESYDEAKKQLRAVVDWLRPQFPAAMDVLENAEEEILAFFHFPDAHHRQIYCTNIIERLNKEIRRRSNVVSIFPNRDALLRLIGSVLIEQQDEWCAAEKRYMSLESMAKLCGSLPLLGE